MKRVRRVGAVVLVLLLGVVVTYNVSAPDPITATEAYEPPDDAIVERGEYLADAGNCAACHTREGGAPFAGGVPFDTAFGRIYSTNITSDVETGIGSWSGAAFRRAMHEGIAADGSRLFPAFPYPSYTKVSSADIAAIFAYLRTLEPVRYLSPDNDLLFSQRWALGMWNAQFFDAGRFVPDEKRPAEWNRGAYLVEGLGHCGACHTPRNSMMATVQERAYEGGVIHHMDEDGRIREWSAVNITSAKNGLASWTVDELAQYFQKGFSRRAGTFGPMNEVIVGSLMKLTPADTRAMAVYLKSFPGTGYSGETIPPGMAQAGESIYEDRCEECHSPSGRGGIFSAPPLAGSAVVQAENPASLINIVLHGPVTPEEVSFGAWETMHGQGDALDDAEIAAVLNYVRGSWGNLAGPVSAEDVARQR